MNALKNGTLLLFVFFLCATSCKEKPKKIIERATATFTKEGTLTITKATDTTLALQLDIEIAETDYETSTGLMDRDSMTENQGMLFIFQEVAVHSFYMKNTQFPLDIIYIDENLSIASLKKNAKPLDESSLSSEVPIQYVLEINAGLADKHNIEVGDKIAFRRSN